MDVLIGIPTHKRPELLGKCLESLAAQQAVYANVRILVADNDPAGRQGFQFAEEAAPAFPLALSGIAVDEPGISAVRNAILDEGRRLDVDYIAMIDDDIQASPSWLRGLLETISETGADITSGPIHFDLPDGTTEMVRRGFPPLSRENGSTKFIDASGAFLISKHFLQKSGWPAFDPDFGLSGGGDSEFFARISGRGARFAWCADARVTETVPPERATLRWLLRRRFRIGTAQIRIARKLGRGETRLMAFAAAHLLLAPISLFALPATGFWQLERWSTSLGRVFALFGGRVTEYADRHKAVKG